LDIFVEVYVLALFLSVQAEYFLMNIITLSLLKLNISLYVKFITIDRLIISFLNLDIFDKTVISDLSRSEEFIQILHNRDG